MSETTETPPESLRDENATLRQEVAQLKAAQAAAERNAAFASAGVDTSTPQGEMFAAGYGGDLKPDAIKERFSEVFGQVQPQAQPQPQAQQVPVQGDGAVMLGPDGRPVPIPVPNLPGQPQNQMQMPPQFNQPPPQSWQASQGMMAPEMQMQAQPPAYAGPSQFTPEQIQEAFGNVGEGIGAVQTGNNGMNMEVLAAIKAESGLDGAESGVLPVAANADMARIWELGSQGRLTELSAHLRGLGIQTTGAISA